MERKRWRFSVTLTGIGKTQDAAWRDATEAFAQDPGDPDTAELDTDQPLEEV